MKYNKLTLAVAAVLIFSTACNPYKIEIPHWPYEDPDWVDDGTGAGSVFDPEASGSTAVYPTGGEKVATLQTTGYFTTTEVEEGLLLHRMTKKCDVTNANQDVYVLEIDLENPGYRVYFHYGANTTSGAAKNLSAIAAVNGTYESDAIYVRTQGKNYQEVKIDENHLRFWKHNGAIVGDGRKIALVNGSGRYQMHTKEAGKNAIALYKSLPEPNILAAAPMLIDNYDAVGATFVPDYLTTSELNKLDYEDYRRHQGVRHPRTAYALTDDNDLLLFVVDGRTSKAAGMTAKELTLFIQKHFNPRWALNMDGGGSSAMYVRGMGNKDNILNNYTDTNDETGLPEERSVSSHLIIQKVAK